MLRVALGNVIDVTGCIRQRFWCYGLYWATLLMLRVVSIGIFALYWTTSLILRVALGNVIDIRILEQSAGDLVVLL